MNNRIKIIIIDDEYLIRELIKNCVSWDEIDVDIVGEASNAAEGLSLISKNKPDIILTDICMPGPDGLDMSKSILEKYPDIKVIIITGYDEFEYAKRSIKLGVSDFILKPINDEELKSSVLKLKEEILEERLKERHYENIKQKFGVLKEIIDLDEENKKETKSLNIEEVKEFILKNISNRNLSLKLAAEHFYVNSSYLSRVFKSKTGKSFSEYVINIKMKLAMEMLKDSSMKSSDIAKKIGIDDPNYFSACFKKHIGCSIKDFRKRYL